MITQPISAANFDTFLNEKEFAVVLLDAPAWDITPHADIYHRFIQAHRELGDRVNFGEVDVDKEVKLAKSLGIASVPTVLYYKNRFRLAFIIGTPQNIAENVRRMMAAQMIGYDAELQ